MKTQPRTLETQVAREYPAPGRTRPVDGILFGADAIEGPRHPGGWVRDTWVLSIRPEESFADFFLEDPIADASSGADTETWVCRGVRADGSIVLGSVNLDDDRFLSEIFSGEEDE